MVVYDFKSKGDVLRGSDIKTLYTNLIKARLARKMTASSEGLIPSSQFNKVTDSLLQKIADEASKNGEQINYRYKFPNYAEGESYTRGNLIYKDWYNQLDVIVKDMGNKADCTSGCTGLCVAQCTETCYTDCGIGCGSGCNTSSCASSCGSNHCSTSCNANGCTSCSGCTGCTDNCSSGCGGCSGCDGCTGCTGCDGCGDACSDCKSSCDPDDTK